MKQVTISNIFEKNILNRFDLIVKYLFVKYDDYDITFIKDLYISHILTFNGANEEDNNKKSIDITSKE